MKLFNKVAAIAVGVVLATGVGAGIVLGTKGQEVAPAYAANVTDTINGTTCSSWKSATTSWHDETYTGDSSGLTYHAHFMGGNSNADGRTFAWNANGYLYVSGTATRDLVSVTITTSANTKTISVYASNTAYSAAPTGNALNSLSATTSGATYTFTGSYKYLALKGTASSTFIKSIAVVYGEESSTPEIELSKNSISVSKGEDATFTVSTINLTSNFSITGGNSTYFTTSFTASKEDGDHVVTLHGVEVTNSSITLTVASTGATSRTIAVSVVNAVYYEKVTAASEIKAGREIIVGSTDGTNLLGKYVSGNNCPSEANIPNANGKLIQSNLPDDFVLFTIGGTLGAWTLTDQDDRPYYGTSGQNYLKAGSSDTWAISITAEGVATITSSASSRSIKYNSSNNIFGAYASGQTDVSVYMIPTTDPEIQVTVTGSQSLGVGETATLTATKINGATGTVGWTTSNSSILSLSSATGDSITVTAGSTLGEATITASLAGCDSVPTLFKVRKGSVAQPYTVAEAIAAIDGSDSGAKTGVYTSGIISQVDSLNGDNSITYWFSDNGTTTDQMEVYKGLGLNSATFSSVDDLQVGDEIVVVGNLTKYSSTYEYAAGSHLHSFNRPVTELATITAIEGTLTASAGDLSWDLSGLTVKGTFTGSSTVKDVTAFVDLSTEDVPGNPSSTTVRNVSVTATGKDDSTITLTQNVSGTISVTSGLVPAGQYRIKATRVVDDVSTTYYLKENGTTSAPSAVTNFWEATIFTFTLVDDDVYNISNGDKYLYSTNTNNGVRFGNPQTASNKNWTIETGEGTLEGAYNIVAVDYTRYLTLYNAQDWRAYDSATGVNRKENTDLQAFNASQFASEFLSTYTAGCIGGQTGGYNSENMKWDTAEAQYAFLSSADKSTFASATGNESGSTVEQAVARYDYIVTKYNTTQTEVFSEFMGRVAAGKISYNSSNRLSIAGSEGTAAAMVVVVMSAISVTAVGGFFLLKKKPF